MSMIKVLIVDDHTLIRDGIVAMLSDLSEIKVLGEAVNGEEAIEKCEILNPDIVVMDIMMPKINGLEAAKIISERFSDVKIIFLSMEVKEEFISEALKAGALGYIPKDVNKKTLITAIKEVHQGNKYFHSMVSKVVFDNFYQNSVKGTKPKSLSDNKVSKRELEVLELIASGLSNSQIAEQLFISVRTVDAHRNHIMQKLELNSTAELVKYAIKNHIIELD
ncbi:response regulator transcription factor [Fulvivirgaceae bacterium BMA10]|uniref:Response regulator transcription factor n=1 Tax=Splendidivirga corallicola TaxID=3051826 RepID=A0ABT8KKB1_9BACT|nr:response regulator transcription factor [Fulvivirgaceae bacterium BMA10]